jgi:D-amino-acid dehydrogenase
MSTAEEAPHVVVVGAGIIGICCALALCDNGFRVTVLDRAGPGEGTSYGAAGNLGGNAHYAIPGLVWKCRACCSTRCTRCHCAGATCPS